MSQYPSIIYVHDGETASTWTEYPLKNTRIYREGNEANREINRIAQERDAARAEIAALKDKMWSRS